MNLDLSFYFAVFLRRIHYFIIITAVISAAAIAAAFLLPPSYQATSLLMIESSSIPGPLSAPTVQPAPLEKLQTIENRLMTRANLIDIANRLNVFKDLKRMKPDDVVDAMRKAREQEEGTDALIDISVDRVVKYFILWSSVCTEVRATAVSVP